MLELTESNQVSEVCMIVGFTGTRRGLTVDQKATFEGLMWDRCHEFHHGSCCGADVEAAKIVRNTLKNHVKIIGHPGPTGESCKVSSGVDDEVTKDKTHFARNRDIVNLSDELIACPGEMESPGYGGTWYTINYARKVKKPLTIVYPDGSIGS